jgi:type II secretory pathway component PulF
MPKFTYQGETATGEQIEKTVEAIDRFGVYEIARRDGHTVTSVTEGRSFSFKKFLNVERINYYESREVR